MTSNDATSREFSVTSAPDSSGPKPPIARKTTVQETLHDDTRVDHYAWLREKSSPEVIEYLEAENAYTSAFLKPTEAFQQKLYQEMLGRIQQTDLSVPYTLRGFSYFTRTEEGKQYPIHCRTGVPLNSPEQTLLDLNQLAEGHSFLGLGIFEVSDDNQLLAYATDTNGFRQYDLRIKDLRTGNLLPFEIPRTTSVAWSSGNQFLFYTVEDETTKRSYRLYRHELGTIRPDDLIYEETDERFRIEVERTRSGGYLLLTTASHTTSEVHYLRAEEPLGKFRIIAPREDAHEYYADHHPGLGGGDSSFYIRTNSLGRTFGIVRTPAATPDRNHWQTVVPHRSAVMLAAMDIFQSSVVLFERENALPHLRVVDLASSREAASLLDQSHRIEFKEAAYNASPGSNPEFSQAHYRFQYESFVTPRSVFDYEFSSRTLTLRKQQPVLGNYDSSQYAIERVHATAPDGAQIPISLVYKRSTPRNGTAPLLLYGYGSYGISIPVAFNSNRLSLLDRGLVFAVAHIRGGGELGKPWHDAGRMHNKMNTFADFIAAAEHLVAEKYASRDKICIEGGSAGGLLMGAVTNLRPDLFRIVISHVPFVDVLNTMLDASLPLTVGEYEEWGNPQIADDYFYMKSYCPYTNLSARNYPTMLVKTSLNDSQVMYWEPAKYVARLRTLKKDSNPLLLHINMGAGHGGASGRYDYLHEIALDYAFLLTQLGIPA